jgi:hypothetical protein
MSPGAADSAAAAGRELGKKLPGFFLVAIGADRIFSFCGHGLQKHELFITSFTNVFIERHWCELLSAIVPT